ncbi:MAG: Gfo/Idh/MocA family protein [Candidatus Hermodarchaeota archaeon]
MEMVRFGILGCGNASNFHTSGIKKDPAPNIKFVAAYDINEKNLNRVAKRNKLTPYNDLDKFLESDMEAVLLLVPHFLHADLTEKIAQARKHVLCEKPMACTLEECDRMIDATKKSGVKLMIAENHRFLPAHKYIKTLLEKDLIGDVFLARSYEGAYCEPQEFLDPNRWNFTFDKGGGGVVMDQGVHKFAMLNWFLGEVDSAQCWCSKTLNSPFNKGEDTAIILLRYKSGAISSVSLSSTTVHPLNNSTELQGTKGTIYEDHSWENPIKIFSSHAEAEKKGEFYSPSENIEHGPYPQYYTISARYEDHYFADCILNDKEPEFTPEQAKQAVAVVLLSYLSAKNRTTTSMDELRSLIKEKGSNYILDGFLPFIQKNYDHLNWK